MFEKIKQHFNFHTLRTTYAEDMDACFRFLCRQLRVTERIYAEIFIVILTLGYEQ